jgi:hypothetical protein
MPITLSGFGAQFARVIADFIGFKVQELFRICRLHPYLQLVGLFENTDENRVAQLHVL